MGFLRLHTYKKKSIGFLQVKPVPFEPRGKKQQNTGNFTQQFLTLSFLSDNTVLEGE